MIVDFHTHIFPPRVRAERERYTGSDACFAAMYGSEKARIVTAEELVASMDRDGVDVSVAANFNWSSANVCRETNDYIIQSVRAFPQRLVGFGAIPAGTQDGAIDEIERCARAGMKGMGELRPDQEFFTDRGGRAAAIMANLSRNNLVLLLHCSEPVGHQYPGKGDITPECLYPFITAFPGQTIICAHWGGGLPFYALMPEVKKALQNVYFDSAASPYLYRPDIYRAVSQIVGADKVLFGSDYPLLAQKRAMDEVRSSALSDADKALILGENARKILGL